MTDPDLTAQLAEVNNQEPSEAPGPSCSNDQQIDEVKGTEKQKEEAPGESWPPIPASQRPKPETHLPIRTVAISEEVLNTRVLDPLCDPDWPLAHLYPVYLSNFRCPDVSVCQRAVRQYFAARGLLVRWCFSVADDYFRQFQQKANLYDGLVYFTTKREAELAIKHCDYAIFNNYTMNVLPGREPVYFPADRSIQYRDMRFGYVYSEEFLWRHLVRYGGGVRCVVKFDISNGAAEFYTPEQMQKAFAEERQFEPSPVAHDRALQKQRYVESDIKEQILEQFRKNPIFIELDRNDPCFQGIQTNKRPDVIQWWGPPEQGSGQGVFGEKAKLDKELSKKMWKMRSNVRKALAEGREIKLVNYPKEDRKMVKQLYEEARIEMMNTGA